MNKKYFPYIIGAVLVVMGLYLITTYNSLVKKDEKVKLQWSEVQNAYQRRLDLIPSLLNTIKGTAGFEANVLQEVTDARAKANFVNVSANNVSGNAYEAQKQAQNELVASANNLLITIEKYPELQSTKSFILFQNDLKRTELRIKVARKDFNEAIQYYNSSVRGFPTKMVAGLFGFLPKNGFQSDAGAEKSTEIKFK